MVFWILANWLAMSGVSEEGGSDEISVLRFLTDWEIAVWTSSREITSLSRRRFCTRERVSSRAESWRAFIVRTCPW